MTDLMARIVISGLITALLITVPAFIISLVVYQPGLLVGGTLVGIVWASLFSMIHVRRRDR